MTDNFFDNFMKNQVERQKEWSSLFMEQKIKKREENNIIFGEARKESNRKYKANLKEMKLNT